ncbi:MAG: NAD+ synthase [Desulfovibrio sp.]|nr:MAG: NAD+ synthase [Desulfovibrio sp.]
MSGPNLRVALAQINTTVGGIPGNEAKILDYMDRARSQGADVVVFPELAVTGYPPEDLLLKQDFLRVASAAQERIARQSQGIITAMGWLHSEPAEGSATQQPSRDHQSGVVKDDSGHSPLLANCAALLQSGRVAATYSKQLLPNYGVFDEARYFTRGTDNLVLSLGEHGLGLTVCEDIWSEDGPHQAQAQAGARLLLNVSASPFYRGKGEVRQDMLADRAKTTGAAVVYCNLVGGQDELVFDGQSLVLGPDGQVLARGAQFEEELIVVDIPAAMTAKAPASAFNGSMRHVELSPVESREKPSVLPALAQPLEPVAEAYAALVLGTRDYAHKNGFREAVIGLSGGIDSALTATLATDALGPDNVHGVAMPSRYSSDHSLSDAEALARNLGIDYLTIPIEPVFSSYLDTLAPFFAGRDQDVTEENLQPRIRGALLMALSNKFHWLVLATGNKSETGVGYSTLYGDTAGGFAVIKDVVKTLVYELCRYKNHVSGREVIPENVLSKPPSAELKPDQQDTDTLPSYDILDPILTGYIEEDLDWRAISARGYDPELVKQVIAMVDRNEYKRRQCPPGVRITTRAFGKDWRVPITNRYRGE